MPNTNPVPGADSWFISNGTALLPAERLLANDTDADGDTLSVTSVANATNGTVSLVAGVIQFDTAGGASAASFDYTVDDGHGGTAVGTVSIDIVNTSYRDDVVVVPASADFSYLNGRGGQDSFTGGDGPDTLIGGGQFDTLAGAGGDDFLVSGPGGGSVLGGAGNDTLDITDPGSIGFAEGGADNDTIFGGGMFSSLDGGPGIDVMHGGSHFSVIYVDNPDDVALPPAKTTFTTVSYTTEVIRTLVLLDGAIDGTGGDLVNRITGNGADNTLLGLGSADTLTGNGGNDTLDGGAGSDVLIGGAGDDSLDGGIGTVSTDFASYQGSPAVNVSLAIAGAQDTGGAGFDTLVRIENLRGGNEGDRLTGDAGKNRLEGGFGNDTMSGGGGGDALNGDFGNDLLRGADGNDTLFGHFGADRLLGGAGNNSATGGEDNDLLLGGIGNDSLQGDNGDDTLKGEAGDDSLNGGVGADTAVFAGNRADYDIVTNGGVTTVTDLAPSAAGDDGADTLTGVELLRFADIEFTL